MGLRSARWTISVFDGAVIARARTMASFASIVPPVQHIAATHQIIFFAMALQRGSLPM